MYIYFNASIYLFCLYFAAYDSDSFIYRLFSVIFFTNQVIFHRAMHFICCFLYSCCFTFWITFLDEAKALLELVGHKLFYVWKLNVVLRPNNKSYLNLNWSFQVGNKYPCQISMSKPWNSLDFFEEWAQLKKKR